MKRTFQNVCRNCGHRFVSAGNRARHYCSPACRIAHANPHTTMNKDPLDGDQAHPNQNL